MFALRSLPGRHRVSLAWVAIASVLGGSEAMAQNGTLRVLVTDEGGVPLDAVSVELGSPDLILGPQTGLTDLRGEASFTDVPPARYTVVASREGFAAVVVSDLVVGIGRTTTAPITLNRGPATIGISGLATLHEPYCGGAAPPPGLEGGATTPRPRVEFVARPGRQNIEGPHTITFVTDDRGRFAVQLPRGVWCLAPTTRPPISTDLLCEVVRSRRCEAVVDTAAPPASLALVAEGWCSWAPPCGPQGPPPP